MIVGLHGLIHLLGGTKAFGWAAVQRVCERRSAAPGSFELAPVVLRIAARGEIAAEAHCHRPPQPPRQDRR